MLLTCNSGVQLPFIENLYSTLSNPLPLPLSTIYDPGMMGGEKRTPDSAADVDFERVGFWYDRLCEKNHKVARLAKPESSIRSPLRVHGAGFFGSVGLVFGPAVLDSARSVDAEAVSTGRCRYRIERLIRYANSSH